MAEENNFQIIVFIFWYVSIEIKEKIYSYLYISEIMEM